MEAAKRRLVSEAKVYRIGKLLARAGLCPRRKTAEFLREHDVRIGGVRIQALNHRITEEALAKSKLTVDGREIPLSAEPSVIIFHKPTGVVCSHRRQNFRGTAIPTIFEFLPAEYQKWFFAGRLDVASSGLVVLSNDGDHIFALSHPSQGVIKTYHVHTSRPLSPAEMARLESGIWDRGELLRARKIQPLAQPAHYEIHLQEGKNRAIRRMLARCGVRVNALIRTRLGPYQLGALRPGEWKKIPKADTLSIG